MENIAQTAFDILTANWASGAPEFMISKIEKEGGIYTEGRLLFPKDLLVDTIKSGLKDVLLARQ